MWDLVLGQSIMDGEHEVNGDKEFTYSSYLFSYTILWLEVDWASRYDQFSRGHPLNLWQTLFTCLQS